MPLRIFKFVIEYTITASSDWIFNERDEFMKIVNCTSGIITIDLGEAFGHSIAEASGERTVSGFVIYTSSLKQIKPIPKELTKPEKDDIKRAVLDWNSTVKTLQFI